MKKTASAIWQGGLKDGKGQLTTESGALKGNPYGFNTRFEGQPGTNPEELIGAAHAGCFSMALSMILGEAGLTAKLRASNSTLKLGTLQPVLPALMRNDSRLLPQTFRGAWLSSSEVEGLSLDLGRVDRVNQRDSSDNQELSVFNGGKRNIVLGSSKSSDEFLFAGGRYQWTPELATSYYYGGLDGIYKQHLVNLVHQLSLGEGQSFKTDIRYARSTDDGGSNVDNDAFGALFNYRLGAHGFSAAYQQLSGDTGFAYVAGADNALVNLVQINDFGNQDERSWQLRYDFDFAALGVPGDRRQRVGGAGEGTDLMARQRQRLRHGGAQIIIIVDQGDRTRGHVGHARFKLSWKWAPASLGSRRSDPPMSAMMSLAMTRPSPRPDGRLVTKGVKSWPCTDGSMPGPLSITDSSTVSASSATERRMVGAATPSSASSAFCSRLTSTCSSRIVSAMTRRSSGRSGRCRSTRASRDFRISTLPSIGPASGMTSIAPVALREKPRSSAVTLPIRSVSRSIAAIFSAAASLSPRSISNRPLAA